MSLADYLEGVKPVWLDEDGNPKVSYSDFVALQKKLANFEKRVSDMHYYAGMLSQGDVKSPLMSSKEHERLNYISRDLKQIAFGQYKRPKSPWERD
jgi:hypothetical protein